MAGRPKTMVKRVTSLEERAFHLALDLCHIRPAQYAAREGEEGDDVAFWWNRACRAVGIASVNVAALLCQLEERAGLDWEALEQEREQRRGLLPCVEAEEKGPENAEAVPT